MEHRELENKIRESLEQGFTFEEIRKAMIQDGYSRELVDNILSDFRKSNQIAQNESTPKNQGREQQARNSEGTDESQNMLQTGQDNQQPSDEAEKYNQGNKQKPESSGGFNDDKNSSQSMSEPSENSQNNSHGAIKGKSRSPVRVVIFTVVSFGFYFLYWEYLMMKYGLTSSMDRSRARLAGIGLWFVTLIPLVNFLVWGYFMKNIISVSETDKNPLVYTLIYMALILTGIGALISQYMLQEDINSALSA